MRSLAPGVIAIGLAVLLGAGCASFRGARLYQEGSQALESGDAQVAVVRLEEAAREAPAASEIQNHLGLAYAAAGREADAKAAFEQALRLDCDNDAARDNLRALYAGWLRPPEARR